MGHAGLSGRGPKSWTFFANSVPKSAAPGRISDQPRGSPYRRCKCPGYPPV